MHIVDDEQRSDRRATPMRPSGSGGTGHLRRWRSSTMYTDIACVAPPCICLRTAGTRPLLILGQAPRREAAGDAVPSSRPSNNADEAAPPAPEGLVGLKC